MRIFNFIYVSLKYAKTRLKLQTPTEIISSANTTDEVNSITNTSI